MSTLLLLLHEYSLRRMLQSRRMTFRDLEILANRILSSVVTRNFRLGVTWKVGVLLLFTGVESGEISVAVA